MLTSVSMLSYGSAWCGGVRLKEPVSHLRAGEVHQRLKLYAETFGAIAMTIWMTAIALGWSTGACSAAETTEDRYSVAHPHSDVAFEGTKVALSENERTAYETELAGLVLGGRLHSVYRGRYQDAMPAGRPEYFDSTCLKLVEVPVRSPNGTETACVNLSCVFEAGQKYPTAVFTEPSTTWLAPNMTPPSNGNFWDVLSRAPWTATLDMPVEPLESTVNGVLEELWRGTSKHPLKSGGQIILRPRSRIAPSDGSTRSSLRGNTWLCQLLGVNAGPDGRGGFRTSLYVPILDRGTHSTGMSPWR